MCVDFKEGKNLRLVINWRVAPRTYIHTFGVSFSQLNLYFIESISKAM